MDSRLAGLPAGMLCRAAAAAAPSFLRVQVFAAEAAGLRVHAARPRCILALLAVPRVHAARPRRLLALLAALRVHAARPGRLLALLAALAAAACNSGTEPDPPSGMPGTITYQLVSPNQLEGALLFSTPAEGVLSVPTGDALTEVVTHEGGGQLYVAVVHRFGLGTLTFELEVADVEAPPELELLAVVGPDDRQRSLAGMRLEVAP